MLFYLIEKQMQMILFTCEKLIFDSIEIRDYIGKVCGVWSKKCFLDCGVNCFYLNKKKEKKRLIFACCHSLIENPFSTKNLFLNSIDSNKYKYCGTMWLPSGLPLLLGLFLYLSSGMLL